MGLLNEIRAGRFNRQLSRLFNIGGEPPAPQLASDVQSTADVLSSFGEMYYLRDERLCAGNANAGGVVAAFTNVKFVNPLNSGVLAIARFTLLNPDAAVVRRYQIRITRDLSVAGFGGAPGPVDTRWQPPGTTFSQPSCFLGGTQAGLPVSQLTAVYLVTSNTSFVVPEEYVVSPGWGISINPDNVNQSADITAHWRERVLGDLEV